MRVLGYLSILYFSFLTFAYAGTVHINGQATPYVDNATLGILVGALIKVDKPYWPACYIRNDSSYQEAQLLKKKILTQLRNLHPDDPDFQKLKSDIERFKPYGRLNAEFNPDLIRLRPELNFILRGDYHIQTQSRPHVVKIIGMTSQSDIQDFNNTSLHSGLVKRERYLPFAENNFIYLVSPDGKILKISNAYWNYQERDIMPGSTFYIPIKLSELTTEMKNINDEIAQLLATAEERNE